MPNKKQRDKNRATARWLWDQVKHKVGKPCINCGEKGGEHFFPPSVGEAGFFVCKKKEFPL